MRAALVLALVVLSSSCRSEAQARVTAGETLLDAREGPLRVQLQRATAGARALYLVTATLEKGAKIEVLPAAKPSRLGDLVTGGPVVAVNGGFYDEQGRPMGLAVRGGKVASPLKKGGGSGVFLVDAKGPRVVHRDRVPKSGVREAVQSIDRVVDGGRSLIGARASAALDARSAVSVDRDGRVRLLVIFSPEAVAVEEREAGARTMRLDSKSSSTGVSLAELARFLVDTGSREALNLDGGYSTSFEARLGGERLSVVAFGATVQALTARP